MNRDCEEEYPGVQRGCPFITSVGGGSDCATRDQNVRLDVRLECVTGM